MNTENTEGFVAQRYNAFQDFRYGYITTIEDRADNWGYLNDEVEKIRTPISQLEERVKRLEKIIELMGPYVPEDFNPEEIL